MKTIGIVCEGDRDYEMLRATIMHFMNMEYFFVWLQPNPEFGTQYGNGWKGVWRWCEMNGEIIVDYMNGITPQIDLLIIQMDADVARCEKEVYCQSVDMGCIGQGREHPLTCSIAKDKNQGCPQQLPPNSICNGSPESRVLYLTNILDGFLNSELEDQIVITIPCDSTDTWIMAAFEEPRESIESFIAPWEFISRKKDYHGIRVSGHRKPKIVYGQMIKKVCDNWDRVISQCPQARVFEERIRTILCDDVNNLQSATIVYMRYDVT